MLDRLTRALRGPSRPPDGPEPFALLVSHAEAARDAKLYPAAAALYETALALKPENAATHIQCGHMFKEAGDLARAELHYLDAQRLTPDDPDLALQLGHFLKVAGRHDEAAAAYRRARDLAPGWAEPQRELDALARRPEGDARLRELLGRADTARDAKRYAVAAPLYGEALASAPERNDIRIQWAHMLKETGDLAAAEAQYLEAQRLAPDDPELSLQIGHFYKIAGQSGAAVQAYEHAARLRPGWSEAVKELSAIRANLDLGGHLDAQDLAAFDRLAPELFPTRPESLTPAYADGVYIRRLGARQERSPWGLLPSLRGVEAIRGFCISSAPLAELSVLLDGQTLCTTPLDDVELGSGSQGQRKHVFNVWIDFSGTPFGPHLIELRFAGAGASGLAHRQRVIVAPPLSEAEYPDSDAVVEVSSADPGSIGAQINARPSVVRPGSREALSGPICNVLVLRTDQLGDLVTSIPAVRRLREIVPGARLVALLTFGNAEFARTLDLFDEIIVIDFPDDLAERRRIMPAEAQRALRARLESYRFDIAIDLAESRVSRPLLLLSGARFLYGFHDRDWPWLTGGFEGATHDPKNHLETAAQSTKVLALIERLGATLHSRAEVIRRPELKREALSSYGLADGPRFAVLHTGARIAFSRWPHYPELAALLLQRTDLKVVLVSDDASTSEKVGPELIGSDRFLLLQDRLPFDDFDALLSFCTVFIGNDSGPKHLASLRGTNVVSLHSARINWSEWGQELTGSIISRRLPCAGCAISHDADECGRDFVCITGIRPEEVFEAVAPYL